MGKSRICPCCCAAGHTDSEESEYSSLERDKYCSRNKKQAPRQPFRRKGKHKKNVFDLPQSGSSHVQPLYSRQPHRRQTQGEECSISYWRFCLFVCLLSLSLFPPSPFLSIKCRFLSADQSLYPFLYLSDLVQVFMSPCVQVCLKDALWIAKSFKTKLVWWFDVMSLSVYVKKIGLLSVSGFRFKECFSCFIWIVQYFATIIIMSLKTFIALFKITVT